MRAYSSISTNNICLLGEGHQRIMAEKAYFLVDFGGGKKHHRFIWKKSYSESETSVFSIRQWLNGWCVPQLFFSEHLAFAQLIVLIGHGWISSPTMLPSATVLSSCVGSWRCSTGMKSLEGAISELSGSRVMVDLPYRNGWNRWKNQQEKREF